MKPLAIDLFCGLGGWTEGLLAEGYTVIGFDNERHAYGDARYPSQLVIQDVLTIHGSQFKDAALIVASPPCQAYSYRAMPWKRAKALPPPDNTLFYTCFRIQSQAIEAAGHHIPLVIENVCGAQKWVGKARWHFGSFYLWGDVPALMPITKRAKVGGLRFDGSGGSFQTAAVKANFDRLCDCGHSIKKHVYESDEYEECSCIAYLPGSRKWLRHGVDGVKVASQNGRRTDVGNGARFTSRDCGIENTIENAADGHKQRGSGAAWWRGEVGSKSSKSSKRKAASAHIAKIPYELARHIGAAWKPTHEAASA